MTHELNFIDPRVSESDKQLFLGPITDTDGPFIEIEEGWTMAHVMHKAGLFPSVKQAKNNKWDRPIPEGFNSIFIKKKGLSIYTMTPFKMKDDEDVD